jgi:uncharacterized surface protein with fasciclin (FAS1) repeats
LHLQALLGVHVLTSEVMSADITDGLMANTSVVGEALTFAVSSSGVTIASPGSNGTVSTVVTPDLVATNGVVHIVDAVLLPTYWTTEILGLAGTQDGFTTLTELLTLSGLASQVPPNIIAT